MVHFVFLSSSAGCLQRGACKQASASASACMCPEVEISERPERRPDSTFYILMGQDTLREERVPHPAGRHLVEKTVGLHTVTIWAIIQLEQ